MIKIAKKNTTGFTLVELLVTLIILGILAAIAIPRYTNAVEQRRGEVCINNMRMIIAAWKIYNMKNAPNYFADTANFQWYTVGTINTTLNTEINEKNFGDQSTGVPGFILRYLSGDYYISANRLSGTYAPNNIKHSATGDWSGNWFNTFPKPE